MLTVGANETQKKGNYFWIKVCVGDCDAVLASYWSPQKLVILKYIAPADALCYKALTWSDYTRSASKSKKQV